MRDTLKKKRRGREKEGQRKLNKVVEGKKWNTRGNLGVWLHATTAATFPPKRSVRGIGLTGNVGVTGRRLCGCASSGPRCVQPTLCVLTAPLRVALSGSQIVQFSCTSASCEAHPRVSIPVAEEAANPDSFLCFTYHNSINHPALGPSPSFRWRLNEGTPYRASFPRFWEKSSRVVFLTCVHVSH